MYLSKDNIKEEQPETSRKQESMESYRDNHSSNDLRKIHDLNVRNEMCCKNSSNRYETQELFSKEYI